MSANPYELRLTPDERHLLIGHLAGPGSEVAVMNVQTGAFVGRLNAPGGIASSASSSDDGGARLWFGMTDTSSVFEVQQSSDGGFTSRVIGVDAGLSPGAVLGLGWDATRQSLYFSSTRGIVGALSPATGVTTAQVTRSGDLRGAAYDALRDRLYVANEVGFGHILAPPQFAPVPVPTLVLPNAWGAALTPDGVELWLTNSQGGTLTIIDLQDQRVRTLTGLGRPRKIAFDPSGRYAVIANENGEVIFFQ